MIVTNGLISKNSSSRGVNLAVVVISLYFQVTTNILKLLYYVLGSAPSIPTGVCSSQPEALWDIFALLI